MLSRLLHLFYQNRGYYDAAALIRCTRLHPAECRYLTASGQYWVDSAQSVINRGPTLGDILESAKRKVGVL